MTDKELIEKIAHWRKHDFGACACLGNCKRCGYHMCHGCLCFVLDELESRPDERQKVLAKVESWLDEPKSVYVRKNEGKFIEEKMKPSYISVAELIAMLEEMKEGK